MAFIKKFKPTFVIGPKEKHLTTVLIEDWNNPILWRLGERGIEIYNIPLEEKALGGIGVSLTVVLSLYPVDGFPQ